MTLRYRLVNVFAIPGNLFSGNPLCVFEDGSGLSEEQMQALALQFNLSETSFIVPPEDGADVGVRIFTPRYEMAFAGHPTLGTAAVLRDLGRAGDSLRLSMPAGVIPLESTDDLWTLTALPGTLGAEYPLADLAACVGLEAADLVAPAQQVSTGSPQVIAQTRSVDALERATGDAALMRRYAGMGTKGGETLVYLWCVTGDGTIEARALFTQGATAIEDPATGSACSNLGAQLGAQGRSGQWVVSQGAMTGRPSTLHLSVDPDRGVRVGGLVTAIGSGEVVL
ncbi:MAG TPA: PhzF family phenazine biosynthesis protein [Pedococcus sp.]|nr:PhzF family phenazine biosynthesis protein [Pedococcus sp.]